MRVTKQTMALAEQLWKSLVKKERPGGSEYWTIERDNGELSGLEARFQDEFIFEQHEGSWPDDHIFEAAANAVAWYTGLGIGNSDDEIADLIYEIEGEIYTHALKMWFANCPVAGQWVDSTIEEFGNSDTIEQTLLFANARWQQHVARCLVDWLEEQAGKQEEQEGAA